MWLALLAVAIIIAACAIPYEQILTFNATDRRLLGALSNARNELIAHGVTLAKDISITNQSNIGIPVRFAEGSEGSSKLQHVCENDASELNGCTAYRDNNYNIDGIWLRSSLNDSRLNTLVLHEMIHALCPGIEHLTPDQIGVFTLNSNSPVLTSADLALIGQYIEIT